MVDFFILTTSQATHIVDAGYVIACLSLRLLPVLKIFHRAELIMPKINTTPALPAPVNLGPSGQDESKGYVPLTSFFNDSYVIEHMALAKEIGSHQQGGVIKKLFNKKDSFLNSEEKVKSMDYAITDGFLYRAHRSDSQTVMMKGITRNTEQNTSESLDDYLTKLFNHTASHGSQSAVLSFSSQKDKAKKFMSEEKTLLKINADSEADRNEFISTPQLILQHGGRLLEAGKIDRLTLLSAIDQLNNKEHEFFYIGKPYGYHYGEVPPYKVESFGSEKKHNVNKKYFEAETQKKMNRPVSHAKYVGFAKIQSLSSGGCSEAQSKIIQTYTRNQTLFNNYLKQGVDIDNPLNKDAKQLNSALDALPNSTEITYRGFSTEKDVYGKRIVEGDIVKNNLFMSTSLSSVYAKQYASSATSEGVFFEVYGRTGKNISMHSRFQGAKGEAECLFKPDINFEVKSIKSKGNIKYVVIKEIAPISDWQDNIKNIFNGERLPLSQLKTANSMLSTLSGSDITARLSSLATSSSGAVNVNALSVWLKSNNLVSVSGKEAVSQALKDAGVAFSASQLNKAWADAAAAGVQGITPEKSASAPAAPPASAAPPEVNRLRTIVSLAELKEQSGRQDLTPEVVRNALLAAAVPLADAARHPGKEILEVITGEEITGSNYSQNSEALSGALAADYFTAFDATITDEEKLSGDAAKSLLDSPLREYLTEHRGQINMHPWADGLSGAVNTPAVGQQHGKAVRALFTGLKAEPAIGTAWAPGEPASARPGVQQMTERLRGLASSEKAAEEKLTARVAERDVNIRMDAERMARIRAEEKAKSQETDRLAWNALRRQVAGMVAGGQDWRNSHARLREGIEARFSQAYHARMNAYQQDREVAALKLSAMLTELAAKLNAPSVRNLVSPATAITPSAISRVEALRNEADAAITAFTRALQDKQPGPETERLLADMERAAQQMEAEEQRLYERVTSQLAERIPDESPAQNEVEALLQRMEQEVWERRLPDVDRAFRLPDLPSGEGRA